MSDDQIVTRSSLTRADSCGSLDHRSGRLASELRARTVPCTRRGPLVRPSNGLYILPELQTAHPLQAQAKIPADAGPVDWIGFAIPDSAASFARTVPLDYVNLGNFYR